MPTTPRAECSPHAVWSEPRSRRLWWTPNIGQFSGPCKIAPVTLLAASLLTSLVAAQDQSHTLTIGDSENGATFTIAGHADFGMTRNLLTRSYTADLGASFTRYGETRIGLAFGRSSATLDTGSPEFEPDPNKVTRAGVAYRAIVDQLSSSSFPREGYAASLDVFASLKLMFEVGI